MPSIEQECYPAIQHADGDIIRARDCVLVKSGMRKKDIPYVAKIDSLWRHPDTGKASGYELITDQSCLLSSVMAYYPSGHVFDSQSARYQARRSTQPSIPPG